MAKGRTAYQIIKEFFTGKKTVESQFTNPLKARIGSHVRFSSTPEFDGDLWTVTEIRAWDRHINNNVHPMTDYILQSDDRSLVMRLLPRVTRGKDSEAEILLLTQYWPDTMKGPYPWGEESPYVLDGLMDKSGEFVRFQDTPEEERYYRDLCNIRSTVSIIADTNRDGVVDLEEVVKAQMSLWVFRRTTRDEAGQEFDQHLHVELSGIYDPELKKVTDGDKDILILRGESIPSLNVMVY